MIDNDLIEAKKEALLKQKGFQLVNSVDKRFS